VEIEATTKGESYMEGGLCYLDLGSFRPNVGYIRVYLSSVTGKNEKFDDNHIMITHMLHILTQLLGFNEFSYNFFQDAQLNSLQIDNVIGYVIGINNDKHYYMQTKLVKYTMKKYYKCEEVSVVNGMYF
jgi:hypothetical protein